jgi:hypothetical protein
LTIFGSMRWNVFVECFHFPFYFYFITFSDTFFSIFDGNLSLFFENYFNRMQVNQVKLSMKGQ